MPPTQMTSTLTQIVLILTSHGPRACGGGGVQEGMEKYEEGAIPSLWASLELTMKSAESQLLMSRNNGN